MIEQIKECFIRLGYQYISTNILEVEIYLLSEGHKAFAVILFLDKDGDCFSGQQYDKILHQIRERFIRQGYMQIEQLCIIMTEQIGRVRENYQAQENFWIANLPENRLIVYENQNFGSKEQILRKAVEESIQPAAADASQKFNWELAKLPVCTIILAAINCIVFLLVEGSGSSLDTAHMLRWGAMNEAFVSEKREYYRFITSMFLHFGIHHLANNMFVFIFLGKMAEQILGKFKFVFLYFATGILAGVVSVIYNMTQNRLVVSAGASGAIFGIVGAMVWIVLRNRGRQQELSARQLLLFVGVSFYAGIYGGEGVDVAAHVGGFLSGIILTALICRKSGYSSEKAGGRNNEG